MSWKTVSKIEYLFFPLLVAINSLSHAVIFVGCVSLVVVILQRQIGQGTMVLRENFLLEGS